MIVVSREEELAVRRKNMCEFFRVFTVHFRPWLYELTRRYMERGNYPVMACWLLPSYYKKPEDVEVAAIISLLIKDDERVIERVTEFRNLIGDNPYEWFSRRGFVSLGIGQEQLQSTAGVNNAKIAEYMDNVYGHWKNRQNLMSIILIQTFGINQYWNKLHLLWLVLGRSDGIGRGVWTTEPENIRCPLTDDVKAMLRTFFPDYRSLRDEDVAVHAFGFKYDSDFLYAAWAYKDLQQRKPKECKRLATVYQKRYADGRVRGRRLWYHERDGILPQINDLFEG